MAIGVSAPILVEPFRKFLTDLDYQKGKHLGLGGSQVNQICTSLLERGYELTIFTLDKRVEEEVILEGPHLRICVGPYRKSQRQRGLDLFRAEREYLEYTVRREDPDFVHAHWTYEFALGPLATSIPVITTIRDWPPRILWEMPTPYRFMRLLMAVWVFVRGHHFISNSEYIRQRIERWTPHHAPIVPNGIRDSFFINTDRSPDLTAPTIIAVNNGFGGHKNMKTLFDSFQSLKEDLTGATLRLLGSGYGEGEEAHQWCLERGYSEGFDFVGHVKHQEVITSLRDADLLVHPSLEESFGNPLVEAMAQGTPVVGGEQSGAVPWVLDGGNAGVLTNVTSANSLKKAIKHVLSSENQWSIYSVAGYKRAYNTFRLSRVIDDCINEYKKRSLI